jgi:hypothetical protein
MMTGESLLARYRAVGKYPRIILLVLIAAAAGYGLFVQTHLQQIHEFNTRELGHGAKIVEDIVAGIVTTAKKWEEADTLCRFSFDQPYLIHDKEACKSWRGKVVKSGTSLQTKNRCLQIKFSLADAKPNPKSVDAALDSPAFEVNFEAILKELDLPESFELYFIADSKGRIVHGGSSDHLRPLRQGGWLNELIAGENTEPGSARRIRELANLTEVASNKKPFEQFKGGTTELRIDLAGAAHYLYVQPLNLGLPDDEKEGSGGWFLGGAASYDDVLRRSFAVDSYLLFGLVLIVILGFLGWPFLKILLIDARERFRPVDVYELLFSAVALAALLIVLGLSWDAYSRLKRESDTTMKTLADNLSRNLLSEIKEARTELENYDQIAEKLQTDVSGYTPIRSLGSDKGEMPAPRKYWPVRLTWARSDGRQFLKAEETHLELTPPTNIAARPYFRAIVSGERWSIDGSPGLIIHPGRSVVDGQFYSFLAMPSIIHPPAGRQSRPGGAKAPAVALMSLNLRSVASQPMPIGYSFAVVNRQGHTLYHNDSRRALREDYVEEVEQHYQLNAALQGDRDQFLSLTYQTRPHRFYVRRLQELKKISPDSDAGEPGWFMIVYRDMTGAHAVATRAIVLSLLYAVAGALALGMMALLIMRYVSGKLYEGRTAAWLWPSQRGAETYRELVLWSAVLLGGGVAAIAFADGPALVILSLSLPPMVGGLWIGLQLRNRRNGQTPSPSRGPLQWAAGALFVLCFAVPLASGFFKFFWNDEIGRFRYAQQLDAFESRQELISEARRDAQCQPNADCPRVESLMPYFLTAEKPTSSRDDGQLASLLSGWMPIQDSVVSRIRDSASARLGRGAPGGGVLSLYSLLVLPAVILAWFWVKVQSQWILLDEFAQPALAPRAPLAAAVAAGGSTVSQVTSPIVPDFESWWGSSSDDSKRVILQVTAERIANPRARDVVRRLVEEGALVFEPDLGPRPEWRESLRLRLVSESAHLREWETPINATGWTSARWSLLLTLAAISFFLIATQPNLPAQLGALVSTTTVAVSTIRRGLDALGRSAKASE